MAEDDFLAEEQEPERLRRKWEKEGSEGEAEKICPHCGQIIREDGFFCLFCGNRVFENSGLLGRLGTWIRKGKVFLILAAVLFGLFTLTLF